jgi:hypothetical protein
MIRYGWLNSGYVSLRFVLSRDGSVGIMHKLREKRSRVRIRLGRRDFSFLQNDCTSSGAHSGLYSMGTRIKRPGRKADHSPPCSFQFRANSHIACRAAKGLETGLHSAAVSDSHLPCHAHAAPMPFFSRPRHSTAVERRPVGYLPAFGFFRLPRGVPRRLLSEAYQSSSQRSIPTTVRSGSSTLQKRRSVKLLD